MQLYLFFVITDTLSHNIISHKMDEPIIRVVSKSRAALLRDNRKPVVPNHGNTSTQCNDTEWLTYVCKFENIWVVNCSKPCKQLLLYGILSRTPWEPVADPLWSADPSLKTAALHQIPIQVNIISYFEDKLNFYFGLKQHSPEISLQHRPLQSNIAIPNHRQSYPFNGPLPC